MKIKFIFYIIPILVFDVDDLIFGKFRGYNFIFFALIHKTSKCYDAIIEHELEHSRWFYKTLGLDLLLYYVCRSYRVWVERKCFSRDGRYDAIKIEQILRDYYYWGK